ncbi:hypothetical protein [Nocardia cyriacigeorgica]|uniref:hypothetical protein n=1 Tax=Nocardia cyriacigeorgica TaxID=135487 RepID=UPI001F24C3CD|nr:hypothetical protein [Nocardia cyriacigeorgica]
MSAPARGGRWAAVVAAVYSALLTLVIAGPLLGSGYLLLRDAVSTPRSYLTDSALGLGDAAPRAVPQDALLATLSTVVDGGLIVKAILLAALWAAGYGAAILSRVLLGAPLAAQLVAVTVAIWNPFVAERLLQGHWSLLTGYAALPWTALAAHRLRQRNGGQRTTGRGYRDWAVLAGCFAAAGLTPTGALLASLVGLTIAGRRNLPGTLALVIAASAPWLVATVASGAGTETSDPAGIAAFAARAEPGLGTLGSLAGLGGIWNADAVPWPRTTPLAFIGTAILLLLVALGVRTVAGGFVRRRTATDLRPATSDSDRPPSVRPTPTLDPAAARTGRRLLGLAVAAVLLPALGATAWGMEALEWLVVEVPGAGLLRDTQKYVALAMPAYALSAAAGCVALAARFGARAVIAEPETGPDRAAPKPSSPPLAAGSPSGASTRAPAEIGRRSAADTQEHAEHGGTPVADGITEAPPANGTVGSPDTAHGTLDRADPAGDRPHQDSRGIPDDVGAPNAPDVQSRAGSAPVTIRRRPTAGPALTAIAALFIAALILPLIDLAWGVGGEMRAVRYPAAWQEAAARVDGPGDVAVLPGGMFRKFPYSGSAPVLDPAPRMLPNDVLQTGELPVRGQTVSGEGARARRVEQLLLDGGSPEELAALGVGWVLVEHRTPGPRGQSEATLAQLEPVLSAPDLSLYRVGGVITEESSTDRTLVIGAHVLWAALLLAPLLAFVPAPRRFDRNR